MTIKLTRTLTLNIETRKIKLPSIPGYSFFGYTHNIFVDADGNKQTFWDFSVLWLLFSFNNLD